MSAAAAAAWATAVGISTSRTSGQAGCRDTERASRRSMGVQQAKYPPTPKTVHVQIPGTCEIVVFCGERVKIAGGMNRADRPADSEAGPGLSGGAWQGAQVPAGESEGDGQSQAAGAAPPAGGPRGGRRPPASGAGQSQRADSLLRRTEGRAVLPRPGLQPGEPHCRLPTFRPGWKRHCVFTS